VYERDGPREEVGEFSSSGCGLEIEAALNAEFGHVSRSLSHSSASWRLNAASLPP